nr:hypothetical protein [Ktedonobacter racemifer]
MRFLRASLGFNSTQWIGTLHQSRARSRPVGILRVERIAKVSPREPLDQGNTFGVLVRRFRDVVPGDPTKRVFCPEQRKEALASWTQDVWVSKPVRPPNGQGGLVSISRDYEGRRGHVREARIHKREVLGCERSQVISALARRGKQHTSFDPRVGQILFRSALGIEDSRAQQHARRLGAPGVSGCGDAASIEAPTEAGNGSLDKVKLVEDALHVLDAKTPD